MITWDGQALKCDSCGSTDDLRPYGEDLEICGECLEIAREIEQRYAEHEGGLRADVEEILGVSL